MRYAGGHQGDNAMNKPAKIAEIKRTTVSPQEWEARVDLAAV